MNWTAQEAASWHGHGGLGIGVGNIRWAQQILRHGGHFGNTSSKTYTQCFAVSLRTTVLTQHWTAVSTVAGGVGHCGPGACPPRAGSSLWTSSVSVMVPRQWFAIPAATTSVGHRPSLCPPPAGTYSEGAVRCPFNSRPGRQRHHSMLNRQLEVLPPASVCSALLCRSSRSQRTVGAA